MSRGSPWPHWAWAASVVDTVGSKLFFSVCSVTSADTTARTRSHTTSTTTLLKQYTRYTLVQSVSASTILAVHTAQGCANRCSNQEETCRPNYGGGGRRVGRCQLPRLLELSSSLFHPGGQCGQTISQENLTVFLKNRVNLIICILGIIVL